MPDRNSQVRLNKSRPGRMDFQKRLRLKRAEPAVLGNLKARFDTSWLRSEAEGQDKRQETNTIQVPSSFKFYLNNVTWGST